MRSDIEQRNVDVVERFRDAFSRGDGYLDYLTDEPTWRVFHSERVGRAEVQHLREHIVTTLYPHGNTPEVQAIVAEGDRVVVQQTITAITNSGADYFNYYVIVYELTDDGRIHTVWEYLNNVYSRDKFDLSQL
jgi:ketosteroid isomerase-like protein